MAATLVSVYGSRRRYAFSVTFRVTPCPRAGLT